MRLLLDQHYPPKIAQQLRERAHDVASAEERPELRGLSDFALWSLAITEQRALVTENAVDFGPIVQQAARAAESHFGVVFTSPRSMPPGRETIGAFVNRLDGFLREHPADDALADQVHWLGSESG